MVKQELINYISANIRRGVPYEDIQAALLARGHSDYDITEAVNFINGVGQPKKSLNPGPKSCCKVSSGLKYFFLGFFCLLLLIAIVLIMIPAIKNAKTNLITIEAGTLSQGKSFDLLKNNIIEFGVNSESYNFTIKSKGSNLIFDGSSEFTLDQGETHLLDIDLDTQPDYTITTSPLTDRRIFIQSICVENWECEEWGNCLFNEEIRVCTDLNSCGTVGAKPEITRECGDGEVITEIIDLENRIALMGTNTTTEREIEFKEYTMLTCGEGFVYDEKDYCAGTVSSVSNSTTTLDCCFGQIADTLELSDSLRSVWTSATSSGECEGELIDSIFECSSHKCLSENSTFYRGILGFSGIFCAYYQELENGKELYCEYDPEERKNVAGYYNLEHSATVVVHNSSGTFLDGVQTRNYPQEAIDVGHCQIL